MDEKNRPLPVGSLFCHLKSIHFITEGWLQLCALPPEGLARCQPGGGDPHFFWQTAPKETLAKKNAFSRRVMPGWYDTIMAGIGTMPSAIAAGKCRLGYNVPQEKSMGVSFTSKRAGHQSTKGRLMFSRF